jgi:murein DD-endopeptidase MepM/ murein hydrolase activator NlpD
MAKDSYTEPKKKQGKLKHKYQFSIYNDASYKRLWHIRLSGMEALVFVTSIIAAIIVFVIVMIAFTPLREFIPGYPNDKTMREIANNALRADSLELVIYKWELQLANINRIVSGEDPVPIESTIDPTMHGKTVISSYSKEDSLLRMEVEREAQFHVISQNDAPTERRQPLETIHFFPPLKGAITDRFNMKNGHFAVDIVAAPNAVVSSTLDGTVIMANWTTETGYVIQIQHKNNLISIYKHNAKLLKRPGETVHAGETIAIVGNSGELTTGPHLHFELWYNGYPMDPEKYITF